VLFLTCATGQHIKSAVLTGRKAGKDQRDYLTVTFSDILVTQYEVNGDESSSSPAVDSVSLNYSKVEYEYKLQNPDGSPGGSVKAGYDFRANKKF
jgi:type VI secretion system secreted protein Hcp